MKGKSQQLAGTRPVRLGWNVSDERTRGGVKLAPVFGLDHALGVSNEDVVLLVGGHLAQ